MKPTKAVAASSMAALIAASTIALAQETPGERDRQQQPPKPGSTQQPPRPGSTTQDLKTPSQTKSGSVQFLRGTKLQGMNVTATNGESIGDIEELAFDVQNDQVAFVILDTGLTGDKYAVPFKAFNFDPRQEKATLNFDRTRLQSAPKFTGNFDDLKNRQKVQEVYQYYGQKPYWEGWDATDSPARPGTGRPATDDTGRDKPPGTTPPGHTGTPPGQSGTTPGQSGSTPGKTGSPPPGQAGTTPGQSGAQVTGPIQLVSSSDLLGSNVESAQNEKLCEIEDVMVAHNNGRLAYMVLGCGGFLGMGEDLIAVPWQAANVRAQQDDVKIGLSIDKNRLEQAPKFAKNQWPDMSSEVWAREIHAFYGTDSGWIYGYTEPGAGDRDMPVRETPRPGSQTGGTIGGATAGAWSMNDEYMRLFNNRVETVNCRVTNVSTFTPGSGKAEGVVLVCTQTGGAAGSDSSMGGRGGETGGTGGTTGSQTGGTAGAQSGQTIRVHLGPKWYIDNQPRQFKAGDNITVEGCRVNFQGEDVFFAKEIQADGQTMMLRQDNGHPMWLAWQGQGAQQPGSNTPPTPGRSPTTPSTPPQRPGTPGSPGTGGGSGTDRP